MDTLTSPQAGTALPARFSLVRAAVFGGLFAGLFDLTFAFVYYGLRGATPLRILQSIAGGLLGKATREGGAATATLGFALHFLIAGTIATLYVLASRRLRWLVTHPVPFGLAYGAAVYFVMNMVVLPLSAYHSHAWPPPLAFWPILGHMVGIGLPIAWIARTFRPRQTEAERAEAKMPGSTDPIR